MKRHIFTQFAFAAAIIGTIAVMMFALHGAVGVMLYLAFAAVCMLPAYMKARAILNARKTM